MKTIKKSTGTILFAFLFMSSMAFSQKVFNSNVKIIGNLELSKDRTIHGVGNLHFTGRTVRFDNQYGVAIGQFGGNGRLLVKGQILTQKIQVAVFGSPNWRWADYVFKKEYDLPSIEEVEQHIIANGHLKDIPSAEEVVKEGIDLGEMNAKLLAKIEELTLYMIEMNKRIKSLEQEDATLKSSNAKTD